MSSSTLIDVFGHIVFSFTRGVTEHYNPEEPEFTADSFGYNPLESTGREWYRFPVDELIYQEYSDREATNMDFLGTKRFNVTVIDACSREENEETQEDEQDEDRAMAWKRLRPSALCTVCKSMYHTSNDWSFDFASCCFHCRDRVRVGLLHRLQNVQRLPISFKDIDSSKSGIAEINF